MPSGYTVRILEGCTFEQFVWTVARQFGALVMMRDEPLDAPIPERFEPSDWHVKKIEEARAALKELADSSEDELRAEYVEYKKRVEAANQERDEKDSQTETKYSEMLAKVLAWQPPSSEHQEMKQFMIDQINDSLNFDVLGPKCREELMTFKEWKREQKRNSQSNLDYHVREHAKEVERVEKRNIWIKQLRDSLATPRE